MIYAALNNVLDQITDSRATRWPQLLEALLQLLSIWHVTGFCETTPANLVPRITQSLTICRAQSQRIGGVRPSEIRDRWPPPASSINQQQPEDILIKLAIKLAYNLKKSHSSTDLARSVFWTLQFRTPAEEADHGINTFNPEAECPIRMTYNRMMTSFRLLRKSRVGSQLFDELRLKSDTISEYKMSFNREIVEFHTAIELIRNHEESVICQPILGELWDRIFLRIQNFFTQLAIYQNIDKSWCSSMARMVGLYCHTILMIHARFGAILRILETSEHLMRGGQSDVISDEEIGEFQLTSRAGGGYSAITSPIPQSRTPQSSASQDLSPGRGSSGSILEDEIGDLASSLLCMSPVAYSKVSRVMGKCKSAEELAFLLGAAEMWPDGSIPSTDAANIIKGVETGRQWLEQRHNTSTGSTNANNTVFDQAIPLDYAQSIWIALKMRLVPNCYSLDAKWLNVMVSVVGDVCLQYAEGLLLVPDMNVKGQKWIYSPSYLDWVKESKEFITMKFTQLQMRTMLRAHSIVLRDTQHRNGTSFDQTVDKLQEQFAQKFAVLESKAEQTVQSAVEDLRELSESVMQLLRHMKTNNSKASEGSQRDGSQRDGTQRELTQRELQSKASSSEANVFSAETSEDGPHVSQQLITQETHIAQVRLELEDLREWVNGMYGELSARISALAPDEAGRLDKKSSSDFWLAHEVNKIKATLAEYVESTRLQLLMLQSSIRDLQKERSSIPRRRLSETTNMQENAHGPDLALEDNHDYFISEDAKFGAASPDGPAALSNDLDPFNSQNTKSSSSCNERCQTRSTDDVVSHALLTYIRSTVSAAAVMGQHEDDQLVIPRGLALSKEISLVTSLDRIDAESAASEARSSIFTNQRRRLTTTGSLCERAKRGVFVAEQICIDPVADRQIVILRQADFQELQTGIIVGVARLLSEQRRSRKKRVRFSRQLDIISSSSDDDGDDSNAGGGVLERHTTAQTISRTNWLKSWKQAKSKTHPPAVTPKRRTDPTAPSRARRLSRILKKNVPHHLNWDWGAA